MSQEPALCPRREAEASSAPHRTIPQPDDPFTRPSIPQSINPLPNQPCWRRRCPLRRECISVWVVKHVRVRHTCMNSPGPGPAMDTRHVHKQQPVPAAFQTPSTHTQTLTKLQMVWLLGKHLRQQWRKHKLKFFPLVPARPHNAGCPCFLFASTRLRLGSSPGGGQ